MGTQVQTLCRPCVPLWVSKKYSQKNNIDSWYGKPESLLAQTLWKLKKIGKKTSLLKLPKNIPRNPRDFPSMVTNSIVVGYPPTE
jgi:hypothetical protein